jgi:hypothetical protein
MTQGCQAGTHAIPCRARRDFRIHSQGSRRLAHSGGCTHRTLASSADVVSRGEPSKSNRSSEWFAKWPLWHVRKTAPSPAWKVRRSRVRVPSLPHSPCSDFLSFDCAQRILRIAAVSERSPIVRLLGKCELPRLTWNPPTRRLSNAAAQAVERGASLWLYPSHENSLGQAVVGVGRHFGYR